MELLGVREPSEGGFNFENCQRNANLIQNGFVPPMTQKTGTTIAGIIYKDGVILGADTRATMGHIISDKNCRKIHFMRKNIYCCGAGTAADTDAITNLVSSQMALHCLNTGRDARVVAICHILQQRLYRFSGNISAALILGGIDKYGSHLYSIDPDGSVDDIPFATMGSGSLAAMSVLERLWQPKMALREARKLLLNAIMAGGLNDLGSGCAIDLCIIRTDGTTRYERNTVKLVKNVVKIRRYNLSKGATEVISTSVEMFEKPDEVIPMDIS